MVSVFTFARLRLLISAKRLFAVFTLSLVTVTVVGLVVVNRQEHKKHHLDPARVIPTLKKTGYRFTFKERGISRSGVTRFVGVVYSKNGIPLRFAIFVANGSEAPLISPSVIGVTKRLNAFQQSIRNVTILTEQGDGAGNYGEKSTAIRTQMAVDIESKIFHLMTKNPFFGGD